MFVGHYSASLAMKAADPRIPLGVLFLAAQLVDIAWAILVMTGVEQTYLVPGFTATNDFDLAYVPYTHSLTATVGWAAFAFLAWTAWRAWRDVAGSALLVAFVVLSHWFLDLAVHTPDLPLYGDQLKQGFGLWNYPYINLAVEAGLFFVAMALYYRATHPIAAGGSWQMIFFGLAMFAIQTVALVGPRPETMTETAASALGVYLVFAALAEWFDRKRAG